VDKNNNAKQRINGDLIISKVLHLFGPANKQTIDGCITDEDTPEFNCVPAEDVVRFALWI